MYVCVLAALSLFQITMLFVPLNLVAAEMLMMSWQGQIMSISRKDK